MAYLRRFMSGIVVMSVLLLLQQEVMAAEETSSSLFQEPVPDFLDDAMQFLGFDESRKKDLLDGKVLFSGMPEMEVLDEQLTVVGVMLVINRPMHEIVDLILAGESFRGNVRLSDFGLISDTVSSDVTLSAFRNVHFTVEEKKEINILLHSSPGTDYNFSKSEFASFDPLDPGSGNSIEEVSARFRDILLQRYLSYVQDGRQGIATYQRRRNSTVSPAEELGVATDTALFLKKHFPDFHQTIVTFPASSQADISHRFYWMKQIMDERPQLALSHHTLQVREDYAIALDEHYYSSHSYNAMHTLIGLVPIGENTLILSSNRTFTDKILGFASRTKRRTGRRIVAKLMAEKFTSLKQILEAGAAIED